MRSSQHCNQAGDAFCFFFLLLFTTVETPKSVNSLCVLVLVSRQLVKVLAEHAALKQS